MHLKEIWKKWLSLVGTLVATKHTYSLTYTHIHNNISRNKTVKNKNWKYQTNARGHKSYKIEKIVKNQPMVVVSCRRQSLEWDEHLGTLFFTNFDICLRGWKTVSGQTRQALVNAINGRGSEWPGVYPILYTLQLLRPKHTNTLDLQVIPVFNRKYFSEKWESLDALTGTNLAVSTSRSIRNLRQKEEYSRNVFSILESSKIQ